MEPINLEELLAVEMEPHYSADTATHNKNINTALESGLVVFDCNLPDLFTVDLDKGEEIVWDNTTNLKGLKSDSIYTRSRGGRLHFWAKLKDNMSPGLRASMAVLLGGDPMREYLSLYRVEMKVNPAYVMFETTEEAARVRAWFNRMWAPKLYGGFRSYLVELKPGWERYI